MSNEALIEALAKRLVKLYGDDGRAWLPLRDAEDANRAFVLMARECLRQMSWAAHSKRTRVIAEDETSRTTVESGISIAPDDWKPE